MPILTSYKSCSDNFGAKSVQHKRVHNNNKQIKKSQNQANHGSDKYENSKTSS